MSCLFRSIEIKQQKDKDFFFLEREGLSEKKKKAKWLSEEVLQMAEKREVKGKGEKERYTHLNAEFKE